MKNFSAKGFTLTEFVVTLMVAGIGLGIAVPAFREFGWNTRMAGASNDLLRSMQLARNEAIKRQVAAPQSVVVCASANPIDAAPTCSHGGNPFQGWIVFLDANGNWQFDNGVDAPIEQHNLLDNTLKTDTDFDSIVSFTLTGFSTPAGPGGLRQSTAVLICDKRGHARVGPGSPDSTARALIIDNTGRTRVTRSFDGIDNAIAASPSLACPT